MKKPRTIAACLLAGFALLTEAQTVKDFVKGADVGFLTGQEQRGVKFQDRQGKERECLELLKNDYQLTAIRMRVWVNPKNGTNDKNELLAMALRAKKLGMDLMVDFHYADSWADPSQQPIPAAWQGHSYEQMKQDLRQHTIDVLTLLKQNGVTPRWVQVGNETANGLLWPVGHIKDNPLQYAGFIRTGYDAVKEVFPEAIVIVHLDRGHKQQLYDWNLDIVKKHGGKFDMVGMSLYPYWARKDHPELNPDSIITDCISNIRHVSKKYGCDVMIVETGYEMDESHPEVMLEGRRQLARVINEARTQTDGHCRGVFYWEPQCLPGHYQLGAFDSKARPTAIMEGFIEAPIVSTTSGLVQGIDQEGTMAFLGIPYAKVERFMPPQPVEKWTDVRRCDHWGPMTMQPTNRPMTEAEMSEQCCVLNVWTTDTKAKKPVMFWLHGGGFDSGTSAWDPGMCLAKKDVVVVGINHRLNILGFLDLSTCGEKYRQSGNVGMLDAVQALQWVHDNIEKFGGDPNNVTIFGESGGGGKVGTLMCMPKAKGLFHKAIIMSGTILNVNTKAMTEELGEAVLKELGIDKANVDRIKDVPYKELYAAGQRAMAASIGTRRPGTPMMWGFGPTPDGETLLQQPFQPAFASISDNIPLMIGTTFNELQRQHYQRELTLDEARTELQKTFGDETDDYITAFDQAYPDHSPQDLLSIDWLFRPKTIITTDAIGGKRKADTYVYMYTVTEKDKANNAKGSAHGAELKYCFNVAHHYTDQLSQETLEANKFWGEQMSSVWSQFAHNGNPGLSGWHPYTQENGELMVFGGKRPYLLHNHDRQLAEIIDRHCFKQLDEFRKKQEREKQQKREYKPSPVAGTSWNAPGNMNPIIPGYFADPTIRKFGDTYYIYATTDGTGNGYGPAQVWVSKDFVNWKNIVMNWPTTKVVWAPDVVQQPDGTYRYYYCEPCNINIGESTSPIGPWKNLLGKDDAVMVPDRYIHNVITLDPQLFRDDDGSEYLYFTTWGIYKGFGCGVAKLKPQAENFKSQVSNLRDARRWNENHPFPIAADEFFSEKRLIPNTELKDIFEAPFVFKRNGIYYFTYSSGSCHTDTYRVQYATSTAGPMGPFTYQGELLTTNEDETVHGPGHHSIIDINGKYYIVYHRHNNPKSVHGFNRQVCIDELKFDEAGNILPVVPTHNAQGVSPLTNTPSPTTFRNLAFDAKVTASSHYDEWFKPEYAVDDNNATLWKAASTNWGRLKHQDEWLQIDLGKPQKFNEVWTQFEYATFFYQYKIETSMNGKDWTLYADRTQNTQQGSPMIDKGKVKARHIRITITDTQKNGHMPAIWNVKVWQKAPTLPDTDVESNDGYPGMHKKDVEPSERGNDVILLDVGQLSQGRKQPFDVTGVNAASVSFEANKPIRARVKDGKWALFFNGTQRLTSNKPLMPSYRYNAPYTIAAWVLSTKVGPVSTIASLSASRADLATTEFRLGSDPQAGLMNHNGSFESYGMAETVKSGEGKWQFWVVTFDGWKERVYLNGQQVREQNNFLMVRPDGHITIGADGSGSNSFMGYISRLKITPSAATAEQVKTAYETTCRFDTQSLGDDDFEEIDPDSKFTLSPNMKTVFEKKETFTLSAQNGAFNDNPLQNGGYIYKEVEGDFVVMGRVNDLEGLSQRAVKGYNEGGLLVSDGQGTYYQLGAFPLYNCGNMFTVLSRQGRPQFPNYKGYDFDPILQFERRGNQLFARTSKDGKEWTNMPGSPVMLNNKNVAIGAYQTTYSDNLSWAKLSDFVIYQKK